MNWVVTLDTRVGTRVFPTREYPGIFQNFITRYPGNFKVNTRVFSGNFWRNLANFRLYFGQNHVILYKNVLKCSKFGQISLKPLQFSSLKTNKKSLKIMARNFWIFIFENCSILVLLNHFTIDILHFWSIFAVFQAKKSLDFIKT